jgi:hypothetical protein
VHKVIYETSLRFRIALVAHQRVVQTVHHGVVSSISSLRSAVSHARNDISCSISGETSAHGGCGGG